jgi:hypothetical protein
MAFYAGPLKTNLDEWLHAWPCHSLSVLLFCILASSETVTSVTGFDLVLVSCSTFFIQASCQRTHVKHWTSCQTVATIAVLLWILVNYRWTLCPWIDSSDLVWRWSRPYNFPCPSKTGYLWYCCEVNDFIYDFLLTCTATRTNPAIAELNPRNAASLKTLSFSCRKQRRITFAFGYLLVI